MSQIARSASISALVLLGACISQIDTRGHVEAQPILDQIKPGVTSREDVQRQFGSPSSQSNFGGETWYYISLQRERKAFFRPKTLDQDVTRIAFDTSGIVSAAEHYTLKDGEKITMVERTTPTEGHNLGMMEQLLGNLGRFNKARNKTPNPTRPY